MPPSKDTTTNAASAATVEPRRFPFAHGGHIWRNPDGFAHHPTEPAIVFADGDRHWCQWGHLHRTDGPAIESPTGPQKWHYHYVECDADTVTNDWLAAHYPDAPVAVAATLHTLTRAWTYGDTVTGLYTAALAAHQ